MLFVSVVRFLTLRRGSDARRAEPSLSEAWAGARRGRLCKTVMRGQPRLAPAISGGEVSALPTLRKPSHNTMATPAATLMAYSRPEVFSTQVRYSFSLVAVTTPMMKLFAEDGGFFVVTFMSATPGVAPVASPPRPPSSR